MALAPDSRAFGCGPSTRTGKSGDCCIAATRCHVHKVTAFAVCTASNGQPQASQGWQSKPWVQHIADAMHIVVDTMLRRGCRVIIGSLCSMSKTFALQG